MEIGSKLEGLIKKQTTVEDLVKLQRLFILSAEAVNARLSALYASAPSNHEQTPAPDSDAPPSRWLWRKN